MTIRNLDALLQPESVVVVGGSDRAETVGGMVVANLLAGGFGGRVHIVNPRRVEVPGALWSETIEALPEAPGLAVIVTPAATVPDIVGRLGARGTRVAVVISAGITADSGLRQAMLDAARPHLLRIVGPNGIGAMLPHAGLNASFARDVALRGKLALVSQSGALVTAILDWAGTRGIGFSGVISVGDMADVDLGDLIDLFASDPNSSAILLYIEGVTNPAKFITAARAASRVKPVIAIKAGRSEAAGRAALSHTGALAGSWDVYRSVFHRAGIVSVDSLTELFDAAEALCGARTPGGNRLAIITNGGGAGILAVDALAGRGALAALSDATIGALDRVLPGGWSRGNPVDVIGDAGAARYEAAIGAVLADEGVDALLVMHCPTAMASPDDIARATVGATARTGKPVIACWLGDRTSASVRAIFAGACVPLFSTPDDAVRGFGHLVAAEQARHAVMGAADAHRRPPGRSDIIANARAEGRTVLSEVEAKALLAAYGVPVVPTLLAPRPDDVAARCAEIPGPYAIKIVSPQLSHKSDIGGVMLDLPDAAAATQASRLILDRVRARRPDAEITGFAVESMCVRPGAHELIAGIADDPTFGPLIMVGAGGKSVEVVRDKALSLPPLDRPLALEMIAETRMAKLLAGYRDEPAADVEGVAAVLQALSAIAIDCPEVMEVDINPLLVDAHGVVALDARVRITLDPDPASRLMIRPVSAEWAADLVTRGGYSFHVRPVRPDDDALLADLFADVTPEDLRFRFLSGQRHVRPDQIAAMTQIDYRRTMTFVATDGARAIAVATLGTDPDRKRAEIALTTRQGAKGQGVSWSLLEHVLRYAAAEGIAVVESVESADNAAALAMEREMGFKAHPCPGDPTLRIVRKVFG